MSTIESLEKHKEALKKRTPKFVKQGARNIKRLNKNWRKPRGFQSKMRKYKKGKPKMVAIGYKTPKALQDMLKSGLREKNITSLEDLNSLNKKTEVAVLSGKIGKRRALTIISEAKKLGIKFNNIEAGAYEKLVADFLTSRKKVKADRKKKAAEKKKKESGKEGKEKKKSKDMGEKPEENSEKPKESGEKKELNSEETKKEKKPAKAEKEKAKSSSPAKKKEKEIKK